MKYYPLVCIGMPVYNGEKTVAAAIESILAQTYKDFILLISDNASTDQTNAICQHYADLDQRIRYIRQSSNIGMEKNFIFVLEQINSEYFMWAAADDCRSPNFIEINLFFLQSQSDYNCSTSPVRFVNADFDEIRMGDASLDDENHYDRIYKSLGLGINGRAYSLFRRKAIIEWPHLHDTFFLGSDWALSAYIAAHGKMHRTSQGWIQLGANGISGSNHFYSRYRKNWLDWLFPLNRLTILSMKLMKGASLRLRLLLVVKFFYLNARVFIVQFLPKQFIRMLFIKILIFTR
jgi:glycosyltransferase involved in cell wall biosynthesis